MDQVFHGVELLTNKVGKDLILNIQTKKDIDSDMFV